MDTFICNVCFKPLELARFKCVCCIDYDVCEAVSHCTPSYRFVTELLFERCYVPQQCLSNPTGHENHMFLKVPVVAGEDDGQHTEAPSEGGVADQFAVLDSMQIFRLGKLLISIDRLV
jgi:hypothetical protein